VRWIRVNWPLCVLMFGLAALLGYAMRDGGEKPLQPTSADTNLPKVVQ
jgi:hypothetical protein